MERPRHRRSKSAAPVEGNLEIPKVKALPKLVADPRLHTEGINKEDVLTSKLGQNSLKRGNGTPIKKLLAEEMAKESESKRKSPNVIARLMGLDGLPSPQHSHRQQRKSSDKHEMVNASIGIHQKEQLFEGRSSRRSSVDLRDFKDVYEDLEASHVTNHRYSSKWSANSRLRKPEMELIQQKFIDAKRLSTNDKLRVTKEFDDTIEILDSNTDLLLRYLEQPDSLFEEHLHDHQVARSSSLYGHVASLEQPISVEHAGNAKPWKSERDNKCKHDICSNRKREDGLLLQPHNHHGSHRSFHTSKNQLDVKNEKDVLPTRIVVLKPNIGKTGISGTSVSSSGSSHTHPSSGKHMECRSAESGEVEKWRKKGSSAGGSFSKTKSREDRAIAKAITRRMRESFGNNLIISTHSGVRGYAGDESSFDVYESDSSSEMEGMILSSRNSFDGKNWFKHSTESLVSKEAKKRLSERWKMTHRCQDVEPIGKGSTLREMLAAPDREARHEHWDAAMGPDGGSEIFSGSSNYSSVDSPLGISSKEGWKDECVRNSSRSRSLPPSSFGSRQHDDLVEDLMTNEKMNRGRSKSRKGHLSQKEQKDENSLKGARSSSKKSLSFSCISDDGTSSSSDANICLIQSESSTDKLNQHEKNLMLSRGPATTENCTSSAAKHESIPLSSDSSMDVLSCQLDNITENFGSSAHVQEDMTLQESLMGQSEGGCSASLQCPGPEPEFSESSKEADHPSPVSVLEVSFSEDVSSGSDCFEGVNAKLHDLRMQLQLLKMESGGYAETPMLVSSTEDVLQQTEVVFEEKCNLRGKSWEPAYIVDVLINSGLEEFDPNTFFAAWHSPDCPLDPWAFDNLEKKYSADTTVTKSERKLFFDRINSALLETFQHYLDPCSWVKPMTVGFNSKWQNHGVKDILCQLLANQENQVYTDRPEKVLDREMNWLVFRDGIDVIGKGIEELLIDDLILEVATI